MYEFWWILLFFPVKPMAMICGSCHILTVKFCDVQMYMQSLKWADDDIAQYFTIFCDAAYKSHWKLTAWFVWLFLLHKWYRQPNGGTGREREIPEPILKREQKVHTEEEVSEGNDSIIKYFCNTDFASLGGFPTGSPRTNCWRWCLVLNLDVNDLGIPSHFNHISHFISQSRQECPR